MSESGAHQRLLKATCQTHIRIGQVSGGLLGSHYEGKEKMSRKPIKDVLASTHPPKSRFQAIRPVVVPGWSK